MYRPSKANAEQMYKMCFKKLGFKTQQEAKRFAKKKEKEYNCKNKIYFCPLCMRWHITTVKEVKNAETR